MSCTLLWERLLCYCFICGVSLDFENKMNLHLAIKMYCTINRKSTEDFSVMLKYSRLFSQEDLVASLIEEELII